jgi:hypothetical protein
MKKFLFESVRAQAEAHAGTVGGGKEKCAGEIKNRPSGGFLFKAGSSGSQNIR